MEERPNYYSILPANVRYDPNLTSNEKLLYSEITALTVATGECWATNEYFARLYNLSTRSITRMIGNLKANGYIELELIRRENCKEIEKRIIRLRGIDKNVLGYRHLCQGGIDKNVQENNTSINNKNEYYTNQKSVKHKYGEYQNVLLTDEEYNKLKEKFNNNVNDVIKELDEGIELHGYKYKSHYLAILKWQEKRKLEQPSAPQQEEEETPEERAARLERNMKLWNSL